VSSELRARKHEAGDGKITMAASGASTDGR
jgi:hypothetical protein